MAEELRFFLRIALFAGLIGAIYWFVSYEIAGTILLLALGASAALFVATIGSLRRSARSDVVPEDGGPALKAKVGLKRLVGFEEDSDPAAHTPLETEEEPVAHTSAWPILTSTTGLLLGVGLLYGPWFWVPGLALAAVVLWGWSSQLRS